MNGSPTKHTDEKERLTKVIDYLTSQKPFPPHYHKRIYTRADNAMLMKQGIIDMPLDAYFRHIQLLVDQLTLPKFLIGSSSIKLFEKHRESVNDVV